MSRKKKVLPNISNIKVSSNEYLVKYTFWRNLVKLLQNDISLESLYEEISGEIKIGMYSKDKKYKFGDIVWYLYESQEMIVILRSLFDDNNRYPEADGLSFEDNGWETLSLDVDIYSMDVMARLERLVYQAFKSHQDGEHPFGVLTRENIDSRFMRADLSNANIKRELFFFPYTTYFLPAKKDDKVILNGSYRYYDNGLIEYDIIYRFGYVGTVSQAGTQFEALTCNNVVFPEDEQNNRYFYNIDAHSIFHSVNQSENNQSSMDNFVQLNRNDFVNTYFAKISFPVPFLDTNYMVFGGNQLAQVNDGENPNRIQTGSNAVTFGDKRKDSITAILVTYPNGNNWEDPGFNTVNGGLAANSFRCKLIGRTRAKYE